LTISNQTRDRVKGIFEPIALALGRLGLSPNALTVIGFAITVAAAGLLAMQQWILGGIVVFAGGAFDMLDGTLARATGRVNRWGAFMDSVFDRWGEVIVYIGLVAGLQEARMTNGPLLAAAAMGTAVMVSYTRSRSEGLGFTKGAGMAAVGIMPREIRLVILALGLIGAGFFSPLRPCGVFFCIDPVVPGSFILSLALGIIAVGSTITTIQRILHVRNQANQPAAGRPIEQEHP